MAKEMLLVGSKTKDALKSTGLNVSGDALEALNEKVHALVKEAQKRCSNELRDHNKEVEHSHVIAHFIRRK